MATFNYRSVLRKRVFLTGCNGNLGQKLALHLLKTKKYDLFLVDVHPECNIKYDKPVPRLDYVQADLSMQSGAWMRKLRRTDMVVHFACDNPNSDATWSQASKTMDITFNVLLQSAKAKVQRVVVASSNHVMGGWKEDGGVSLAENGSNAIKSDCEPAVGTLWVGGKFMADSTASAVPAFASERLAQSLSKAFPATTFVVVRVGCCQPGDNLPSSLTYNFSLPAREMCENFEGESMLARPGRGSTLDDPEKINSWFRNMWLSNRDFCSLFEHGLESVLPDSANGFLVVNGMSANSGSRWDISDAKQLLGYNPEDDAMKEISQAASS